jgi:hypothetical protein
VHGRAPASGLRITQERLLEGAPAVACVHLPRAQLHVAGRRPRLDRVLDRVLDERLQQHVRHQRVAERVGHVPRDPQALLEAGLLDVRVEAQGAQLLASGTTSTRDVRTAWCRRSEIRTSISFAAVGSRWICTDTECRALNRKCGCSSILSTWSSASAARSARASASTSFAR